MRDKPGILLGFFAYIKEQCEHLVREKGVKIIFIETIQSMFNCEENGNTDLTGKLVINPNPEPGAMRIENAGWVKISLNMMDYTYTVELLGEVSPYLYTPGNHQNWTPATSVKLYSSDFMNYSGYLSLDGEFKFTSAPDWDHTNYGDGGEGAAPVDPDTGAAVGILIQMDRHNRYQWGPHACLGKAVDCPQKHKYTAVAYCAHTQVH